MSTTDCHATRWLVIGTLLFGTSCRHVSSSPTTDTASTPATSSAANLIRLPTGVSLDPVASGVPLGSMPLALLLSPDPNLAVVSLNGYLEQGVEVIDRHAGKVVQHLVQPGAFLGLAFAPSGTTLVASGGTDDSLFIYPWKDGRAGAPKRIALSTRQKGEHPKSIPAGLAFSARGDRLFVAENAANSLLVLDGESFAVLQRLPVGPYPYAVAVAGRRVFVSLWGADGVAAFDLDEHNQLRPAGILRAAFRPSALAVNPSGTRLFVTSGSTDRVVVLDTASGQLIQTLRDPPPSGPDEGNTPNALALSADGTRLFVAEADANAVAIFDLTPQTSGVATAHGTDRLLGRVPTGWYPTALAVDGEVLLSVDGKGRGSASNPGAQQPGIGEPVPLQYTLGQTHGVLTTLPARPSEAELAALSRRVEVANGWKATGTNESEAKTEQARYPPLQHVLYVIKENRTYDQVLGDEPSGDGDAKLSLFGKTVTPNLHALAERFGLWDRFLVNGEVSTQGHEWAASAYSTDFDEKFTPTNYAEKRPSLGDDDDVDMPSQGYLWERALARGVSVRVYGEYAVPDPAHPGQWRAPLYLPALAPLVRPNYPAFNLKIADSTRIEVWLRDFAEDVKRHTMPELELIWLPDDHTSGAKAGARTPRACVANNDLAVGRLVEAVSHSEFWASTAIFIVEDDAQDGPDHVDSHRAPFWMISPWSASGVHHRFANQTDVLTTIEGILDLEALSQFDHFGRPLRDGFATTADLKPFDALPETISLTETNPAKTPLAQASEALDLDKPDASDPALLNRLIWAAERGNVPYPEPTRTATLDVLRLR